MSDEHYFGRPRDGLPRHVTGPFFDPPHDEYNEHGPLDGESLNDDPRTRLMTAHQYRRWKEGRNPHGK